MMTKICGILSPILWELERKFIVSLYMYLFSLIVHSMLYLYVSNINSYFADGNTEHDGSCQLLL
jgi:hypothetical protein